jgi:ElaB/YqjD/DUF883 family membrane-anchored ribosome-binding protein
MAQRRINLGRELRRQTRDRIDDVKERFSDVKEKAEDFVADNPWKSLAIAAAVGALVAVGVTAGMRHERRPWTRKLRDYFE